jgi:hypothetical protein
MNDNNVYLGVWTNWSNGTAMGATLTITRQQGDLLIAFTGFLIPFVASRFWSILCFILHLYYSTSKPEDAIYHQRQVILRNSSSPDTGLVSLFRLLWSWSSHHSTETRKPWSRLFLVLLLAICCISGFTAAGGFSSQISSAPGNEVLIIGDQCGIAYIPITSNVTAEAQATTLMSQRINDAFNYAQQCYSTSSFEMFDCDKFVVKNIAAAVTKNDSGCPFQGSICRSNNTNLTLDTGYIDSNDNLGLNAPKDQRFLWRYKLQCAPLVTEGYTTRLL